MAPQYAIGRLRLGETCPDRVPLSSRIRRAALFADALNSALSLLVLALVLWCGVSLFGSAVLDANWQAASLDSCRAKMAGRGKEGACWAVLTEHAGVLLFGFYPAEPYWHPITALVLLAAVLLAMSLGVSYQTMLVLGVLYLLVAFELIWGNILLSDVYSLKLGGFLLTLVNAVPGIPVALLVGFALAFGERFLILPLRALYSAIIGLFRGVPLVVLLFASIILSIYSLPVGAGLSWSSSSASPCSTG